MTTTTTGRFYELWVNTRTVVADTEFTFEQWYHHMKQKVGVSATDEPQPLFRMKRTSQACIDIRNAEDYTAFLARLRNGRYFPNGAGQVQIHSSVTKPLPAKARRPPLHNPLCTKDTCKLRQISIPHRGGRCGDPRGQCGRDLARMSLLRRCVSASIVHGTKPPADRTLRRPQAYSDAEWFCLIILAFDLKDAEWWDVTKIVGHRETRSKRKSRAGTVEYLVRFVTPAADEYVHHTALLFCGKMMLAYLRSLTPARRCEARFRFQHIDTILAQAGD